MPYWNRQRWEIRSETNVVEELHGLVLVDGETALVDEHGTEAETGRTTEGEHDGGRRRESAPSPKNSSALFSASSCDRDGLRSRVVASPSAPADDRLARATTSIEFASQCFFQTTPRIILSVYTVVPPSLIVPHGTPDENYLKIHHRPRAAPSTQQHAR